MLLDRFILRRLAALFLIAAALAFAAAFSSVAFAGNAPRPAPAPVVSIPAPAPADEVRLIALNSPQKSEVKSPELTSPPTPAVPWGDWLGALLRYARDLLVIAASGLVARYVPRALGGWITDRMVAQAVDLAIAAVEGATRGQTLDLPVANSVITRAEALAIGRAPALAIRLGDDLRPAITARLSSLGALPAAAVDGSAPSPAAAG